MNDHDLLTRRVNDALIGADPKDAARAEAALADYTPGDPVGALILLTTLQTAIGEDAAYAALGIKQPPRLVYCCPSMGWVTSEEKAAHVMDDDYGDPEPTPLVTLAAESDRDAVRTMFSEFAREDRETAQKAGRSYLNDWALEDPF